MRYYSNSKCSCYYCDDVHRCRFNKSHGAVGSELFLGGFRRKKGIRLCCYCHKPHVCKGK